MNLRMLARIQSKLARSLISLDDRARHEPMLRSVLEDAVSNGPEMAAVAMGGKTREVEIFTALHPLMTRHRINYCIDVGGHSGQFGAGLYGYLGFRGACVVRAGRQLSRDDDGASPAPSWLAHRQCSSRCCQARTSLTGSRLMLGWQAGRNPFASFASTSIFATISRTRVTGSSLRRTPRARSSPFSDRWAPISARSLYSSSSAPRRLSVMDSPSSRTSCGGCASEAFRRPT